MRFTRRRQLRDPDGQPKHASRNPLFPSTEEERLRRFRRSVISITAGVVVVVGFGIWIFGPWRRIEAVTVEGTYFVQSESVKELTSYYLDKKWFGLIPVRQFAFFNQKWLAGKIRKRIEERVVLADLSVKRLGRTIAVTVRERVPIATWQTATANGWLDEDGRIVQLGDVPDSIPHSRVVDGGNLVFRLGEEVVSPGVSEAILSLNDAIQSKGYEIEEFILPLLTCLRAPVEPETPDSNGNANTNSARNANKNVNRNGNMNVNDSVDLDDTNAAVNNATNCDNDQLRKERPEVDVKLKSGPLVRFDRYRNTLKAVATLADVLGGSEYRNAKIIDLRFGDRAYIR